MKNKGILILVGLGILLVILFAGGKMWNNSATSNESTRDLAMSCTTDMATQFHIHPVLHIVVNDSPVEIPANIGISPVCMHPLHTHDNTGTIHVESPIKRDFTLSDFFAVWDKEFNRNQILDNKVDANHIITMTVNGSSSDQFENLVLADKDEIVIEYKEGTTTASLDKNPLLSDTQEKALEKLGIDPSKLPSKITPGMSACFTTKLGEKRIAEIKAGSLPTISEFTAIKSCLSL